MADHAPSSIAYSLGLNILDGLLGRMWIEGIACSELTTQLRGLGIEGSDQVSIQLEPVRDHVGGECRVLARFAGACVDTYRPHGGPVQIEERPHGLQIGPFAGRRCTHS